MGTVLSKSRHKWARDPAQVRRANDGLARALGRMPPVRIAGVVLATRSIHFGPAIFSKGQAAERHRHDEWQSEYVMSGRIRFSGGSDQRELRADEGVWIRPGLEHDWHVLRDVVMVGTLVDIAGPERKRFLRHLETAPGGDLPLIRGKEAARWWREAMRVLQERPLGWESALGNLLSLWIWTCATQVLDADAWGRSASRSMEKEDTRGAAICERARAFLRSNLHRPIQLEDVSLEVGVSGRHLNRLFQKHADSSVTNELLALRLARAREMLREDSGSLVKQVAYACGFSTPAYFTYCYRKAFGRPPRQDG